MTRFRLGKWVVVGLAVCVLAAQEAKAGIGFQPVSPDELKMTSEPLAPGAPAIILYRQVDRDDNIHTPHEDNYFRIKILTEEGRKYADIEVPFFKGSEDVVGVRGRTIKPDGSIADFDGKVFEKELVKGRGVKYQPSSRCRRHRKNSPPQTGLRERHTAQPGTPPPHIRAGFASLPGSESAAQSAAQSAANRISIRPRIAA